jgi:hypothetical protein
MQHEGISIAAKLSHNERHALRHQAGDKGDVARAPVELGHDDRIAGPARSGQRCGKLRPPVQRVSTLAAFRFDEVRNDLKVLGLGEALNRGALCLDARARALLLPGGDTIVSNGAFHTNCIPPFALWMKSEALQHQ